MKTDKKYMLPFAKSNEVSYADLEHIREYPGIKISVSASQIQKRMTTEMFEDICADLENGLTVEILG